MIRLLFVDDQAQAHRTLKLVLEGEAVLLSAFTGATGIAMARSEDPDVVLLDLRLGDRGGLEVLREILQIPLAPPVILYTAYGDIPLAVEAMRAGAFDFIEKSAKSGLPGLLAAIRRAALARAAACDPARDERQGALSAIVGASPAIERVRQLALRFGRSSHPVMIRGESGTGKELVAAALHAVSGREGPFVAVNCSAFPDTLVESELFGTEKGAYTDAATRAGLFEQAHGGTLFLDEIADMPPQAQGKLLRVLEDHSVRRLGAAGSRLVDVRVVSASCRPVDAVSGVLRQDLYYRLGVLSIELPPLRERREDIPILAAAFLGRRLSDAALQRLTAHQWPGNVRELRNVLARASVLNDCGIVGPQDIVFD